MNQKYSIIIFFISFIVFLFFYILLFFYQLGVANKAEWWIKNTYQYKDYIIKKIKKPKIIIISGSNSLFGINSDIISKEMNMPVVNLATHAGLPIDFHFFKIKQHLKENDIVIMPLEYGYYYRKNKFNKISDLIAWGSDYIKSLSLFDTILFISKVEPKILFENVYLKINSKNINKIIDDEIVIRNLNKLHKFSENKFFGYTYKSLNKSGDINVDSNVKDKVIKRKEKYIQGLVPSEEFIKSFKKIESFVKSKNAKLILTHPVTMKNEYYNLINEVSRSNVNNLIEELKKENIKISCNPALFHFNKVFFFNTTSHPNKYGAIIRSINLAECLDGILKNKENNFNYEISLKKVSQLEKKFMKFVKKNFKK